MFCACAHVTLCVYVYLHVCTDAVGHDWEEGDGISFYGSRRIIHFIAVKWIFLLLCHQKNHWLLIRCRNSQDAMQWRPMLDFTSESTNRALLMACLMVRF